MANLDAVHRGEFLLVRRRAHVVGAAAIDQRHFLGAEPLGLHRDVDGGVAAADHHDAPPDRQRAKSVGAAQLRDVIDRVRHARQSFALAFQRPDACKPHAEEHRVIIAAQLREGNFAAQRVAGLGRDAADAENEIDLVAREMLGHLVFGDAVFVEAAQSFARLEQSDVVAEQREAMRAGQSRRAAADHRDFLAAGLGARERMFRRVEDRVGGVALQPPDLDRVAFLRGAHAGALAQNLGRADAGAGAAENIFLENTDAGAVDIVGGDLS